TTPTPREQRRPIGVLVMFVKERLGGRQGPARVENQPLARRGPVRSVHGRRTFDIARRVDVLATGDRNRDGPLAIGLRPASLVPLLPHETRSTEQGINPRGVPTGPECEMIAERQVGR